MVLMPRIDKNKCRLWRNRLEEAEKDEAQASRIYAQYAKEAPFEGDREFFKGASRDEGRHHEHIKRALNHLREVCED
jgi:rubrerythrin